MKFKLTLYKSIIKYTQSKNTIERLNQYIVECYKSSEPSLTITGKQVKYGDKYSCFPKRTLYMLNKGCCILVAPEK